MYSAVKVFTSFSTLNFFIDAIFYLILYNIFVLAK